MPDLTDMDTQLGRRAVVRTSVRQSDANVSMTVQRPCEARPASVKAMRLTRPRAPDALRCAAPMAPSSSGSLQLLSMLTFGQRHSTTCKHKIEFTGLC